MLGSKVGPKSSDRQPSVFIRTGIFGESPNNEVFCGKNPENPRNRSDPRPQNFPDIFSGIFGDKTPKNPKIEAIPVPEKSPIFSLGLSPSPPRPRKFGAGPGKTGDWGPVSPH